MFIVLEGLDGAGKSTQIRYLQDYLEVRNHKSHFIHFPRFDAPVYGALIAQFLRGELGAIDEVSPQLVALLFAGDRHHAAPLIRQWLADGYVVIADRYVYSNIAYQCAKVEDVAQRARLRDWIVQTEYGDFNLPQPDINLFLDVPLNFVAEKLNAPRDGEDRMYLDGKSDIHESNLSFQERVRQVYLAQSEMDTSFTIIPCADTNGAMLTPQEIFLLLKEKIPLPPLP